MATEVIRPTLPARTRASGKRETLAALDLGSNSFHLVIARVDAEGAQVLDERREPVRLAEGLEGRGSLKPSAERRALACLERYGSALRSIPRGNVRVVGTNALRKARNAALFVKRAEALLGHPIEIVSGREEARLTYLGVASSDAPARDERRLVVDIGGGSTECMLGVGSQLSEAHSLYMGCVSYTERYFPRGRIKRWYFDLACTAARIELRSFSEAWRDHFETAWGSSGTVRSIDTILTTHGWSEGGITRESLERLIEAMLAHKRIDDLGDISGLTLERAQVLPGGLAILLAALESFGIGTLRAARGAMREGILYDLIGRHADHDVREESIRSFAQRHGVDRGQAERVQRTALGLLRDVAEGWDLPERECEPYLRWAALLHEVGQSLSYTGYHKHGAYLVRHANLAGLARDDAAIIAALIGLHRRRPKLELVEALPARMRRATKRMAVLLRVAVAIHRSRAPERPPARARGEGKNLEIQLPRAWIAEHTLTLEEFRQEQEWIAKMGIKLRVNAT